MKKSKINEFNIFVIQLLIYIDNIICILVYLSIFLNNE